MEGKKYFNKEDEKGNGKKSFKSAGQKAVLYYLVAIYIAYMGFEIMKNRLAGDNTMSYPVAIILTLVFVVGAAWIVWYATRAARAEGKQSECEAMEGIENKEEEN